LARAEKAEARVAELEALLIAQEFHIPFEQAKKEAPRP
jgi:hypothetical protein